jgi:hypothetical protein
METNKVGRVVLPCLPHSTLLVDQTWLPRVDQSWQSIDDADPSREFIEPPEVASLMAQKPTL